MPFIVSSRLQIHHLHVFDYIFSQGLGLGGVARASAITPQHDSLFSLDLGWGLGRWGNNIGYMIPRKNGVCLIATRIAPPASTSLALLGLY